MNKNKTFSQFMTKPDAAEQAEVWSKVMDMAKMFEENLGYSRQTVLEGLLDVTLDLAMKRSDQRYFQHMNNTRRFYLYASEVTKRRFDQYPMYAKQRAAEKLYGKDMLILRDAQNFGMDGDNHD